MTPTELETELLRVYAIKSKLDRLAEQYKQEIESDRASMRQESTKESSDSGGQLNECRRMRNSK
ncbi:hypothetical protein CR51_28530 [Caballeronia megalochromosomata]|nr:hypothetical protein CR51_28530 [Caballeronia megalochromosomata]